MIAGSSVPWTSTIATFDELMSPRSTLMPWVCSMLRIAMRAALPLSPVPLSPVTSPMPWTTLPTSLTPVERCSQTPTPSPPRPPFPK